MTRTLQVNHAPREVLLTGETVCWGDGYPWPCPGELATRAEAVRALHPDTGRCPRCRQVAPCRTRRAVDGQRTPEAVPSGR